MSKVIFDIETIGEFEGLDEDSQDYILKYAEDEKKRSETKKRVALWPFTGQIVAIGLLNPETDKGKVYFQVPSKKIGSFSENGIDFIVAEEKEILENFWQDIKNYGQFITFNGRLFDCPYLMLRSAVLKVKPTKNLMPYRYSTELHVDLLEQLTFYGAFRKFTLDFYCRSFGIKSPKIEGITGEKINQYFQEGKYLEIARYCLADILATKELYQRWQGFINIR